MEERRLPIIALLLVLAGSGMVQVQGMTVYTPEEVEAVNGTDVELKCTFQSTVAFSPSLPSVAWNFQPLDGGTEESVFYFQEKTYPTLEGRFKEQVEWAGDIARGDASILLRNVKFTFNGTFSCHVKNPPDVHGLAGELLLKVVRTASFSEIAILATAIGGAIGVVLLILAIIVSCKFCRWRSMERELEMPQWDRKDLAVCDPVETLPLNSREEVENDSTDEASAREISPMEDEKKNLEVMAEVTTDTVTINSGIISVKDDTVTINSGIISVKDDIISVKDDTYNIPIKPDADSILSMNDMDAAPKEGTNHPSGMNKETTEKAKPEDRLTGK